MPCEAGKGQGRGNIPAWTPALVNPKMFRTAWLKSPAADRKGLARNARKASMLASFWCEVGGVMLTSDVIVCLQGESAVVVRMEIGKTES